MSPSRSWKAFHIAPTNLSAEGHWWRQFAVLMLCRRSLPQENSFAFVAWKLSAITRPGA